MLQLQHRALYASFDRFPSRKGAAIHIDRVARAMFETAGGGALYVLGDETLPTYQKEDDVEIVRCSPQPTNFLERTIEFGRGLERILDTQENLRLCQFRDPWSGIPLLAGLRPDCATIYEINGLPSIELPNRYPGVSSATLRKIRAAEEYCWNSSTLIVTPSHAIKQNLIALGAPEAKITVLPNGADLKEHSARPDSAPSRYIIYFGALQRWQGIDVLLRAMARLRDLDDLWLIVCASAHHRSAKAYNKLAEKLEIAERIQWFFGLSESELAPWRANALLSVAPLTECSRNLEQGCCPLKILESMADGVPVVASDIPSVREIVRDGTDGRLVRPDRPSDLAMAIRVLLEYPDRLRSMGDSARRRIEQDFLWDQSIGRLKSIYESLLHRGSHTSPVATEEAEHLG